MVTLILLSILLILVLGIGFAMLGRRWPIQTTFIRIAWVPLAALLLEGIFFQQLAAVLSYFAVALIVLTCMASLFLASVGGTLVAAARERGEEHARLFRATLVASVPGVLLAAYVVYALVAAVLWSES